ncbi:MAG: YiiD C-terminal domain-containing protein [Neisseria sp.]|nr:YiiD C-terminal domain-containing protein [Neisseria sp.]
MTPEQLQQFLHRHIPASAALGITILACDNGHVSLSMPLQGNQNHKQTLFGGSMALAATVCGWAAAYINCPRAGGNIVIQEGSTRYLVPVRGDIVVTSRAAAQEDWQRMDLDLARKGKGKIVLETEIYCGCRLSAVFQGKYVALGD